MEVRNPLGILRLFIKITFEEFVATQNHILSIFCRYMIAYTNLLRCIENLGIAGAYGIRYYGQGKITHDNYVQLIRHFTLVDEYLEQSKNYVPQIGKGILPYIGFGFARVSISNNKTFIIIVFIAYYSLRNDSERKR